MIQQIKKLVYSSFASLKSWQSDRSKKTVGAEIFIGMGQVLGFFLIFHPNAMNASNVKRKSNREKSPFKFRLNLGDLSFFRKNIICKSLSAKIR